MRKYLLITIILFIVSCGGGDPEPQILSSGLKIFATTSLHNGGFANDPFLTGANAIEKADSFCNSDAAKPNSAVYKAMLIDGSNREAKTRTDWVLQPNTTYYRAYNNVEISTTTEAAIFPILYKDFTNSIDPRNFGPPSDRDHPGYVWSGITDLSDYSMTGERSCQNWSSASDDEQGIYGVINSKGQSAISAVNSSTYCGARLRLYCVEQP